MWLMTFLVRVRGIYLRGLQTVGAGWFSFWGGCVLFGDLNFSPPVQKMYGKDWEG